MVQNALKQQDYKQPYLFNFAETKIISYTEKTDFSDFVSKKLTSSEIKKLNSYNLENYIEDISSLGIYETWQNICSFIVSFKNQENEFLQIKNFGELYEIALALVNKQQKKDTGQYYTPEDVAGVMSKWLSKFEDEKVCDVACGTGKLILSYLDLIGKENAKKLISSGNLYLYDLDKSALYICKTIILAKYGIENLNLVHDIHCDFLSEEITLPNNCKVISNPPYASIHNIKTEWEQTEVLLESKELYSAFMEKIISQSNHSVIITPYSFIGASKFYSLRKLMSKKSGFVVSFDNVPGNIFCGRKHGIFNTNTNNSVRAAITVVENKDKECGFRFSPLIRFKNIERKNLLNCNVLEKLISNERQTVNVSNPMFFKCDTRLENIYKSWQSKSTEKLGNLISSDGQYLISMPNTCRYFTVASNHIMNRGGQIIINFNDKDVFNYVYCLINSSFVYWHWRLFDGGITYPKSLLLSFPSFYKILTDGDKDFFAQITEEMINKSAEFIVTKNNVGIQENIKFPREYRDKVNRRILDILKISDDEKIMDIVHSNMALEINI